MKLAIRSNKKLRALNKKLRISIIILSIILLFCSTINLYLLLNNDNFIYQKKSLYSYSNKAKINYSVALKPNAYDLFAGQKNLGEGSTYISSLVDEIDPSLTYEFSGEKSAELNGHYQVYAIIEGLINNDKNNKTVWQKKIIIQDETNFSNRGNKVSIKATPALKLDNYKQLIDKIIKDLNIQFDINFKVFWNIEITAKTDKGIINEKLCPTMEIPLYANTFTVGGQLSQEKNGAIEIMQKVQAPRNTNMIILSISLMVIFVIIFIYIIFFTTNSLPDDSLTRKLKSIFKEHGDRLVTLKNAIDINDQPLITVTDITDLVRVSDEISRPILYLHNENANPITQFYVIDEKIIYLYNLN